MAEWPRKFEFSRQKSLFCISTDSTFIEFWQFLAGDSDRNQCIIITIIDLLIFGTKIQIHNEIFEQNSRFSNSVEMLKMCFLWLIYFCAFCARIFSWMTDFLLKVMVCDAHYQHHKIHLMLSFLPNNNAAKKKKKLTAVFVLFLQISRNWC